MLSAIEFPMHSVQNCGTLLMHPYAQVFLFSCCAEKRSTYVTCQGRWGGPALTCPLQSWLMPAIGTLERRGFNCPVTSWISNFFINDKQNAAEVLTRVLSTPWKKILSTFCQTARLAHSASLSHFLSLLPSLYLSIYLFFSLTPSVSLTFTLTKWQARSWNPWKRRMS